MFERKLGLVDILTEFHDPDADSDYIKTLRELHDAMDRAVLEAYGWDNLANTARCEFLLENAEANDDDPTGTRKAGKKEVWRLCWHDDFRDKVRAWLVALNEHRAKTGSLSQKKLFQGMDE